MRFTLFWTECEENFCRLVNIESHLTTRGEIFMLCKRSSVVTLFRFLFKFKSVLYHTWRSINSSFRTVLRYLIDGNGEEFNEFVRAQFWSHQGGDGKSLLARLGIFIESEAVNKLPFVILVDDASESFTPCFTEFTLQRSRHYIILKVFASLSKSKKRLSSPNCSRLTKFWIELFLVADLLHKER